MKLIINDPRSELKEVFDSWQKGETYHLAINLMQDSDPGSNEMKATLVDVVESGEPMDVEYEESQEAPEPAVPTYSNPEVPVAPAAPAVA